MIHKLRLGIDIGGVIRAKATGPQSVEEYLVARPLTDVTRVITAFVDIFGSENIFIISRCPEYAEDTMVQWLDKQNFFTSIGFKRSNVYFCRERADKARIANQLKLTHFIDDRIDVLDAMKDIVVNRILFTGGSNHDNTVIDNGIIVLDNWDSVLEYMKINK